MSLLKPLLDAECGTTNPLIKLSHIYTQDDLINRSSSNHYLDTNRNLDSNTTIDELVNEYHRPIIAPNTFHLQNLLTNLRLTDEHECKWTEEFLQSFSNDRCSSSQNFNTFYTPSFVVHPNPTFLDQQLSFVHAGYNNDIDKAADNILFFLQESENAANIECTNNTVDVKRDEMIETNVQQDNDTCAHDQTGQSSLAFQQSTNHVDNYLEYKFIKTNSFLDYTDPFEEGLKCLEVHDIVSAVLFFEAAVQKQNDHIDAWLCLGITQSENEQDGPAICALKKCIELDSKNLQAYITLASCYANETLLNEAINSLHKWLINNDKYSHLLSSMKKNTTEIIDQTIFEELQNVFFQAVALSNTSNAIDSDLQVCLGILFHLKDDYEKAIECFNTAVLAKPNDALLWNKLGAAIANGGHSEKAVDSYYNALTLSPGFIRARYNLGISCFNLNAYKQAIEHFLISLKQQNNALGPHGSHIQMSESIWHTLSIAIDRLKRSDLEQYVASKDLSKLLNEFQIE